METRREVITGAVARGWCTDANKDKTMDSDLAMAIVDEIMDIPCEPGLDIPAEMRRLYRTIEDGDPTAKANILVLLNDVQRNSLKRRDI